jgi:hypothetical protein
LFRILSRMSQFHAVPSYVFKIQFHIILCTRLAFRFSHKNPACVSRLPIRAIQEIIKLEGTPLKLRMTEKHAYTRIKRKFEILW